MRPRSLAGLISLALGGPTLAFHALTPDDTTFEMLGVKTGVGGLTTTHTASLYAPDVGGVYREFAANEPVWSGGRVVQNHNVNSEDISLSWAGGGATITSGVADPIGGTSAFTISNPVQYTDRYMASTIPAGNVVVHSCWLRRRAGTAAVKLTDGATTTGGLNVAPLLADGLWHRVCTTAIASGGIGTSFRYGLRFDVPAGEEIDVWHPQIEVTSGVPSEYIPTFGTAVSKTFANANGNTVVSNVVTEAVGTPLAEVPYLQYYPAATNSCFQSRDGTSSSWGGTGISIRLQDQVGITGEPNTATYYSSAGDPITANRFQIVTIPSSTNPVTYKVWVRKTTSAPTFPGIRMRFNSNTPKYYTVNTDNGTLTLKSDSSAVTDTEVISAGDWWIVLLQEPNASQVDTRPAVHCSVVISGNDESLWTQQSGSCVIGQFEVYDNKTIAQVRGLGPIFTTTAAVSTDRTAYTAFDAANQHLLKMAHYFELKGDGELTSSWVGNLGDIISWGVNNALRFSKDNAPLDGYYLRMDNATRCSLNTVLDLTPTATNKCALVYSDDVGKAVINANTVWSNEYTSFVSAPVGGGAIGTSNCTTSWQIRNLRRYDIPDYQAGKDIIDSLMLEPAFLGGTIIDLTVEDAS